MKKEHQDAIISYFYINGIRGQLYYKAYTYKRNNHKDSNFKATIINSQYISKNKGYTKTRKEQFFSFLYL